MRGTLARWAVIGCRGLTLAGCAGASASDPPSRAPTTSIAPTTCPVTRGMTPITCQGDTGGGSFSSTSAR